MGKISSSSSSSKRRRKKEGRPSKTDLTPQHRRSQGIGNQHRRHRSPSPPPRSESDLRRSTRRRSITYIGDFYDVLDYEDEEEELHVEEEEENEKRRQKKLKLVLKLPQTTTTKVPSPAARVDSLSRDRYNNVAQAADSPPSSSSYGAGEEEDNYKKPFKKRRIGDDDSEDDRVVRSSEQKKKRGGRHGVPDSVPGNPTDSHSGIPLPDSKHLELILDKLQKKDTHGVYAEPVDPEELPDYHDVIEHPMDFGTVRKKLARGEYSNFQQFENDVFLICSNAMQYNAPETIYFKQALSIQELARKKLHRIRVEIEHTALELKSQQAIKPNSIVKTPIKKSPCKTIQEPVGSDFSSGATLATVKDTSNFSNAMQTGACERPGNIDRQRPSNIDRHIEGNGNSSLTESKAEKAEEQISGKGFHSKLGKKPIVVDENRRATYNNSNQPVIRAELMSTIFEGENKQLVSVGLHVDHSYARSLARFAATLGPTAWNVASRRIEQALPSGFKFGCGWVGEYEPLSTPVVMLGNLSEKQPPLNFLSKPIKHNRTSEILKVGEHESRSKHGLMTHNYEQKQPGRDSHTVRAGKDDKTIERFDVGQCVPCPSQVQLNENRQQKQASKDLQLVESRKGGKNAEELKASRDNVQVGHRTTNSSLARASSQSLNHAKERHFVGPTSQGNSGLFGLAGNEPIANAIHQQQQNQSTVDFMRSENTITRNLDLSRSSSTGNPNDASMRKQLEHSSEMASSKLLELVSMNKKFVHPEANGVTQGGVPDGKAVGSHSTNRQPSSFSYNFLANPQAIPVAYFSHRNHEQGLSDPVQMMRIMSEKTQGQQKSPNIPTSSKQITPSDPSSRRDDSSATATTAAQAWMTLGAGQSKPTDTSDSSQMQIATASLYNSAREVSQIVPQFREEDSVSGRQLQSENRFPPQVFLPQSAEKYRPVVIPQLVMSDLSRFQMQPPWRGLVPHIQPNKKPDTLPPDLNVSFQSSGSPVMSSGITSDSQQPDLALQL